MNIYEEILADPASSEEQKVAARKLLDSKKSGPTETTKGIGNVTLKGKGGVETEPYSIAVSPEWAQWLRFHNQGIDEQAASSARFFLMDGLMTLHFWNEDKTKIRNIGGSDMNYDEFFNELQERYPEENIVERLIEHTKEQDAEYAKEAIEHKQRQHKYAEETKQIEQEVRAYFGSAYSEDEIKRQIYYRWQRARGKSVAERRPDSPAA